MRFSLNWETVDLTCFSSLFLFFPRVLCFECEIRSEGGRETNWSKWEPRGVYTPYAKKKRQQKDLLKEWLSEWKERQREREAKNGNMRRRMRRNIFSTQINGTTHSGMKGATTLVLVRKRMARKGEHEQEEDEAGQKEREEEEDDPLLESKCTF